MGRDLKGLLKEAMERNKRIDYENSEAKKTFDKLQAKYAEHEGDLFIWKTSKNNELRQPQLVEIVKAYERYVLVKKVVMSVDLVQSEIRYCVGYNALHCGFDKLNSLEIL